MRVNKRTALSIVMAITVALTGCEESGTSTVKIDNDTYIKKTFNTTEVVRGTLSPGFTMKLYAEGYQRIDYRMSSDDLQVESLNVALGDKVKKGDILASFKSESIQSAIDSYTEQYEQNELLIQHYTKLMEIDDSTDYSNDIEQLKWDNSVAQAYIEEAKNKLTKYQIIAKEDGTITNISDTLLNGFCMSGISLISETAGTGNYTTTVQSSYDFEKGQQYTAVSDIISCDFKIINVDKQTDSDGKVTQILTFGPVADMSAVSDDVTFQIDVKEPEIKDALYIDYDAVNEDSEGKYVFVLDSAGYRDAVRIETGEKVGDYIVILSGLSEGEKVTIN